MATPARTSSPITKRAWLAGAIGVALLTAACGTTSTATGSPGAAASSGASSPASSAAVLKVAASTFGQILVTGTGRTIYMFAADKNGQSSCTSTCLQYWPIVSAPASIASPAGVTATLGVLNRSDGSKQLTVNGMPVYTYAGDTTAGATSGQGKNLSGGLWWVLSPGGTVITAGAGAAPSASTSSKGGYGY